MTTGNLSFVRYKGDGSRTQFPLVSAGENIGYFRTSDIHTYVNEKEVGNAIQPQSPHIVSIVPAPAAGTDVLIRREMPVKAPYSDFARGNNFGHRQVNNSFLQQLYLTQEIIDGFLPDGFYFKQNINMGGFVIKNLGDGTESDHAINKGQLDAIDKKHTDWNTAQDNRLDTLENAVPTSSVSSIVPYRYLATGGESSVDTNFSFNFCSLYINGVYQVIGDAFNFINGVIHFAEPLEDGDLVAAQLGSFERIAIGDTFQNYVADISAPTDRITIPDFAFNTVYLNGVLQIPNRSYARVGNDLVFAEQLEEGDVIHIIYAQKV